MLTTLCNVKSGGVYPILYGYRQSTSHRQPENKSRNLLMATLTMNNNRIYRKYIAASMEKHSRTHMESHVDRIESCGQNGIWVSLAHSFVCRLKLIEHPLREGEAIFEWIDPMIITCNVEYRLMSQRMNAITYLVALCVSVCLWIVYTRWTEHNTKIFTHTHTHALNPNKNRRIVWLNRHSKEDLPCWSHFATRSQSTANHTPIPPDPQKNE